MKDILSTSEAAKILGIEPPSVSKQINRGKLDAVKFGNSWMITRTEVERYHREIQRPKRKQTIIDPEAGKGN